jgi:hypothetical protein
VIHGLVEDGLTADGRAARNRWLARAHAEGATDVEVESGWALLRGHLARVAADPEVARLLALPGRAEVPFRVIIGDLVLSGIIDRLCRDAGGWTVVDWKSGTMGGSVEQEALGYRWQLLVYSLAAERILGERARLARLYFTEAGAWVAFPPWTDADVEAVEARLTRIAAFVAAHRPWAEVEREVTGGSVSRPCGRCGFRRHGCRGWRARSPVHSG